jgi:hypothetical protein
MMCANAALGILFMGKKNEGTGRKIFKIKFNIHKIKINKF